jgi:hypothetical protein
LPHLLSPSIYRWGRKKDRLGENIIEGLQLMRALSDKCRGISERSSDRRVLSVKRGENRIPHPQQYLFLTLKKAFLSTDVERNAYLNL